jgi:hypothetical protein
MLFVRARSVIRADGAPSAQVRATQIELSSCVDQCRRATIARSAREPCFGTDEKRIRTKNTVLNKSNNG